MQMLRPSTLVRWAGAAALGAGMVALPSAQTPSAPQAAAPSATAPAPAGVTVPGDYVIGAGDGLSIVFWRDPDLTRDVVVRPDGMISLPLVNDIQAAGLTPDQLRASVTAAAEKFVEGPNVNVIVRDIKSRNVYIQGMVQKPGPYPLLTPMRVLDLIATAGGLLEYASKGDILIIRKENGRDISIKFNYGDVAKGKNLQQNIELKPGDSIVVP